MLKQQNMQREQGGFASIIIALIMIVVLALLTLGFGQLSRREQTSALDRQLSNQAQYASESGINEVFEQIKTGHKLTKVDKCPLKSPDTNKIGDSKYGVSYSCVLIDPGPGSLEYTNVPSREGRSTEFDLSDSTGLDPVADTITVEWQSTAGHTGFRPSPSDLLPATSWGANTPGVLQFSLTPILSSNGFQRDNLINNTFSTFMYPSSSAGGSVPYSNDPAAYPQIISGACSAKSYNCSVTIKGLAKSTGGATSYAMHFLDLYDASDVRITAKNAGDHTLDFLNSQTLVDSTGKAQDVLKRIVVRIPLRADSITDFAIESRNVCKRIKTYPSVKGTSDFYSLTGGAADDTHSPGCNPINDKTN